MERKSLMPLVKEVSTIVKKSRIVVKGEKQEGKGMFSEGALQRATEIGNRVGNIQYTAENEGFEPGE